MPVLSLLLVVLCLSPAMATEFLFKKSVSIENQTALLKTFTEIKDKFPASFEKNLPAQISIDVKRFQGSDTMPDPCGTSEVTRFRFGEYNRLTKSLALNQVIVDVLKNGREKSEKISCQHGTQYDQAIATIIHELTHAYDFNSGSPSSEDTFKNIAGFKKILFFNKKVNVDAMRSMDLYEFKNPSEAFAVNMEYFLMDEEFACRRPVMFSYFKKLLGIDPFPGRSCRVNYQVMVATQNGLIPYNIDPARVYRIDYLLAESGNDAASGFGHSMFRIVLCAPEYTNPYLKTTVKETPYGKKCLEDKLFHIVASFRANNEGATLNYLKGIFGGYPSMLFMLTLGDVLEEYNNSQMRDMTAYPLKLNKNEKIDFLNRLLEEHWDYKGSYKFFTNNCAVESLKTLETTIAERGETSKKGALNLTPKAMLKALIDTGLVDAYDPEKDSFSAGVDKLLAAFNTIQSIPSNNEKKKLTEFVLKSKTKERLEAFHASFKRPLISPTRESLENAKKEIIKVASFSILEQQVYRSKTDQLKKKLADYTSNKKNFKERPDLFKAMESGKDKSTDVSTVFSGGYGIPQSSEIHVSVDSEKIAKENERLFELTQKILLEIFPEEAAEMKDIAENLKVMNEEALVLRKSYRKSLEKYLLSSLERLSASKDGQLILSNGSDAVRSALGAELISKSEFSDEKLIKLIANLGL